MKKIAEFLVKRRIIFLIIFALLTAGSLVLMQKVNINTDMTKYLPDDSQMSRGLEIMKAEFPDSDSDSDSETVRLMFTGLTEEEKDTIYDRLEELQGVLSVDYSSESDSYNKGDYTLYILTSESGTDVDTLTASFASEFSGFEYVYAAEEVAGDIPPVIIIVIFVVVLAIMIVMCGSWIEPFIFLITIGAAIILNMGTNAFLESVSSTTFGIAILQLVLSMDYSIILSNRYRQACKKTADHVSAMKDAVSLSIPSVLSSSLTTIVGLLALVFMSFKIGADLGFVLAKGVFFSLICVFTILPALMLLLDKLVTKTSKKALTIPMSGMAKVSYKGRYILAILFIALFVGSFIGKSFAGISYDTPHENEILDVFPEENQIVLLYDNSDEAQMSSLVSELENTEGVSSVSAYANTLGKAYTASEISDTLSSMDLSEDLIHMLFYEANADRSGEQMTLEQMMTFIDENIADNEIFADKIDSSLLEQISSYASLCKKDVLTSPLDAGSLAQLLGMDEQTIAALMQMSGAEALSVSDFIQLLQNPQVQAAMEDSTDSSGLTLLSLLVTSVISEQTYTVSEMSELLTGLSDQISEDHVNLIYEMYFSRLNYDDSWTLTATGLFDTILSSDTFSSVLSDEQRDSIETAKEKMEEGESSLISDNYSRAVISTAYEAGSDEIMNLVGEIQRLADSSLTSDHYTIGNAVMAYEMHESFSSELNKITIITVIAIFLVVLLTFRSVIIPAILVLIIQGAVYLTMTVMGIVQYDMIYIALLIMQCVLMGATIDYAIVFTNYYREKRRDLDIPEALEKAYQSSIRTISTSGLIMVFATAVLGFSFNDATIGPICRILSAGVLCALLVILVFLPAILAILDRFVVKRK